MEIKILQVFYDKNGLPYKDKERTVHYPITSGTFLGASNTTKIKFYYDQLDELNESTFVAVSKLPNGKIGSEILESEYDSELQENYAILNLSSFYTQYKGDVYISLQGYQGGVKVEQDENGIYQIYGTPTIQATGSIKLSIAYAPTFIGSGETENITLQRVLAELSTKLGIRQETLHVEELPTVGNSNVWYVVNDDPNDTTKANIYIWNATTQTYVWVGDNTLDLGNYYTKEQGDQFEEEIGNRVSSVESELSSVASGSPKGVYATLDDLETAYPTGTTGIYVVSENGYWYYWNGSAWTYGGVYQASQNPDFDNLKHEVEQKSTVVKLLGNLFDKSSPNITNGYLNQNNVFIEDINYKTSDYIEIEPNETYTVGYNFGYIMTIIIYDETKTLIDAQGSITTADKCDTFTTGATAKYLRFSMRVQDVDTAYVNKGTSREYTPYEYIFNENSIKQRLSKNVLNDKLIYGEFINIFDKNNVSAGKYINGSGGLSSASGFNASDFIEVAPSTDYGFYTGAAALENSAWYNENKELISTFSEYTQTPYKTISSPSNAKYLRVSIRDNQLEMFQITKGSYKRPHFNYGAFLKLNSIDKANIVVVDKNGNGDYTTITDAVSNITGSVEAIIVLMPGLYYEHIDLRYTKISIYGVNREKCIIEYDDGNYANVPLNIGVNNHLKNLTINSKIANQEAITGLLAYAVHFDIAGEGTLLIENCTLNSWGQSALGVGLHENQTLIVRNCELNGYKTGDVVNGGLLIHDYQGSNALNQYAIFESCTFFAKQGNSLYLYSLGDNTCYCDYTFRNCIAISENVGTDLYLNEQPENINCIVGKVKKGLTSYNNNIDELNQ